MPIMLRSLDCLCIPLLESQWCTRSLLPGGEENKKGKKIIWAYRRVRGSEKRSGKKNHSSLGLPRWSPTLVLTELDRA